MSTYYPTIEEDLKRADEILATSRTTIHGADTYAAIQLLASFVEHIRALRAMVDAVGEDVCKVALRQQEKLRAMEPRL